MMTYVLVVILALSGFVLFYRSNRAANQLALAESAELRQKLLAALISGLSASLLFSGLILLASQREAHFAWTLRSVIGILAASLIVGGMVTLLTLGKIWAFRKFSKRLFQRDESQDDE
ncbi:MAG: hypothetical protein QME21_19065 [Anaerolineales bacterium]|nr:hypothetical protein [Anaerolineales bacterium]